jgi:hypothetical protein
MQIKYQFCVILQRFGCGSLRSKKTYKTGLILLLHSPCDKLSKATELRRQATAFAAVPTLDFITRKGININDCQLSAYI